MEIDITCELVKDEPEGTLYSVMDVLHANPRVRNLYIRHTPGENMQIRFYCDGQDASRLMGHLDILYPEKLSWKTRVL